MSSSRKLLSALALVLLVLAVESAPFDFSSSSSGGSGRITPSDTDLRGADLARLLSSPVYLTEKMWRTIHISSSSSIGNRFLTACAVASGPFARATNPNRDPSRHSGVRVTLEDGTKWLIHKGSGYGNTVQTVVTDARHMSSAWQVEDTKNFYGTRTVSELIRVGGQDYDAWNDNCHFAADRIMKLP